MSNFAVTPHINVADEIGFGKTVLMPGDPLRAKFIAENFLENPVLVNNVRGVQGHTGYYKGVKVPLTVTEYLPMNSPATVRSSAPSRNITTPT